MKQAVLEVKGLTKYFGDVAANKDISLSLDKHEILAIVGENGAGKSTFCKMLTGIYHPDKGSIAVEGEEVRFQTPADSISRGISMVYQERNLVGMLTGAQNICLGHEPCRSGLIDGKGLNSLAEQIKHDLGLSVDLNTPVEQMGAGEQQLIEIMRALRTNPKILILDEPTASLGQGEIEPFLQFIQRIKSEREIAIIFISHKFEEVYEIADKIAVFTDGQNVLFAPSNELTQEMCIDAMLRQDKIKPLIISQTPTKDKQPLLEVEEIHYGGKVHNISVKAYPGEVVGFYGLVGAGRTECMQCLFGLRYSKNIHYIFNGKEITKPKPRQMIQEGMILTPEKRMEGLFRGLSLTDNICNLFLDELLSNRFLKIIDRKKSNAFAEQVLSDNSVKYRNVSQPIISLSGGNMQKIIIGRSVALKGIKLMIIDEPTTGMDIGAKYQVYQKLRTLTQEQNLCIMMVSSELDELFAVCDRLYVFANGDCVDHFERDEFDKKRIVETAVRGRKL